MAARNCQQYRPWPGETFVSNCQDQAGLALGCMLQQHMCPPLSLANGLHMLNESTRAGSQPGIAQRCRGTRQDQRAHTPTDRAAQAHRRGRGASRCRCRWRARARKWPRLERWAGRERCRAWREGTWWCRPRRPACGESGRGCRVIQPSRAAALARFWASSCIPGV